MLDRQELMGDCAQHKISCKDTVLWSISERGDASDAGMRCAGSEEPDGVGSRCNARSGQHGRKPSGSGHRDGCPACHCHPAQPVKACGGDELCMMSVRASRQSWDMRRLCLAMSEGA